MKKILFSVGMLAAVCLLPTQMKADKPYELRVLTFEDEDVKPENVGSLIINLTNNTNPQGVWSDFIVNDPNDQGSPALLYGAGGYGEYSPFYNWYDSGNTGLMGGVIDGWGSYAFWSGGEAISKFSSHDIATNGDYTKQLTVYNKYLTDADEIASQQGGFAFSNHFAVHFGYIDVPTGWGLKYSSYLLLDAKRVIDHMYVAPTTYELNCYFNGNSLTAALGETGYVKIEAYGYANAADYEANVEKANNYEEIDRSNLPKREFYLARGAQISGTGEIEIVDTWTKWDLSELGEVELVELSVTGTDDNGYGFSQPGYFAYDNVAVRFDLENADIPASYTRNGLTVDQYYTICLPRGATKGNYEGGVFYTPVDKSATKLTLEEVEDIEAGKAYIFKATAATLNVTYSGDYVSQPAQGQSMQGVYVETTIPEGKAFVSNSMVYTSTGDQFCGTNRAYIDLSKVNSSASVPGRRRVTMDIAAPQMPTTIEEAEIAPAAEKASKVLYRGELYIKQGGHIYNAQGQMLK